MKLADLLGVVGDSPLTQYPWHASLIAALNNGVGDHAKVDAAVTGKELISRLIMRGTERFLDLMESDFDPATGLLVADTTPCTPPLATPVAPARPPEVAQPPLVIVPPPTVDRPFTIRQIGGFAAALLIVLIGLMMAVSIAITSVKNGGEITPAQERMAGKVIDILGEVAKTEKETAKPATPAPAVNDPVFGPAYDPTHPLYPATPATTDPVPQ